MLFRIKGRKSIDQIFKSHKYEGLLDLVKKTKDLDDLYYMRQDYHVGIGQFERILKNIRNCEKLGNCSETKRYYKGIKKMYLDKGVTSRDVELTIEWYKNVYLPAINSRIKEVKNK